MKTYRSLNTIQAVQYEGHPIPGVTCHGTPEEVAANGCDSSRKHVPHVHTQATGGMSVLTPGMWIFPVQGGPFGVSSDARFRGSWEVPVNPAAEVPVEKASFPDSTVPVVLVPETIATPSVTFAIPAGAYTVSSSAALEGLTVVGSDGVIDGKQYRSDGSPVDDSHLTHVESKPEDAPIDHVAPEV